MSMRREKISGMELIFLLTGYIHGSVLLTTYVEAVVDKDSWIIAISGFIVMLPFVIIYSSMVKRFPGMDLIQIHDVVYGKYLGKVISILYIFYFIMILSFNFRFLADLYVTFLMPETPLEFFIVIFPLVCAYAVWKGIEVLARVSHLFVVISFLIIFSTVLLLIPKMDFLNFLPIFEMSLDKFIKSTHIAVVVPFGEIFVFLAFASALNDVHNTTRNMLIALFLGFISFFTVAARNTAVLGNNQHILTSSAFQAARLIEVGEVFSRMDILVGIGQTIMIFVKSSVLYYAVVVSLARLLGLKTYTPLIIPIGGIAVVLAITDWQSSAEYINIAVTTAPVFVTPFILILPLSTLLTAKIRGLKIKEGEKAK